jgi:hypothetical protein
VGLEKAVNEIGARCLPYPEKGSTIGQIAGLFGKEIQALLMHLLWQTKIS